MALLDLPRRAPWLAILLSIALVVLGCGPGDSDLPPMQQAIGSIDDGDGGAGGAPSDDDDGEDDEDACEDGDVRDCHVTLGEHEGIITCFVGIQTCEGGAWQMCADGTTETKTAPWWWTPGRTAAALGVTMKSYSSPGTCVNNLCDPGCKVFHEDPPPLTMNGGGSVFTWQSGTYDNLPADLKAKGTKEPCSVSKDCQFDQYCHSPASSACDHSVCAPGTGLANGCNDCVTKVCAADPTCCDQTTYTGTCSHSPCDTGTKLSAVCDVCVAAVCAAASKCCSNNWDASCVAKVGTVCGKTCPYTTSGTWKQSCVDKVETICGAQCDDPGTCAHDKCYTGAKLDAACDPCVAEVCASRPSCCTGEWDALCTARVASVCGESCGAEGQCLPWLPGQKNTSCNKADLTVGVPCNGTIPVCNVGTVDAPNGVQIRFYNQATAQDGSCNPSNANSNNCVVNTPIPAGQCVDVPTSTCPGVNQGKSLVVNANGIVPECFCDNNWAYFDGGSCGSPVCSSSESAASIKKVNMFVAIDRSGSMADPVGVAGTRWSLMQSALASFFQSPDSAGLGVALRFWPYDFVAPGGPYDGAVSPQTPESEPNNTSATADLLNAGTSAFSAAINPANEYDWFTVTIPAGGSTLTIETHSVGDEAACPGDTVLRLYQSNGNTLIASDDDGGVGACSLVTATLAAGTYRVRIEEYGKNAIIPAYELRFTTGTLSTCTSGCGTQGTVTGCGNPQVPLGTLTAQASPADAQEKKLLDALYATSPSGSTPSSIALEGAIAWGKAYKAAHPTEEVHVVFMTDGEPTVCDTDVADIAAIAADGKANGVITDVIGIVGVGGTTVAQIASAGGGKAFYVSGSGNTADDLLAAMVSIKGVAAPCHLQLPESSPFDPDDVSVVYTPSAGPAQSLVEVGSAAACVANGFYYDDPAAPSSIWLCPSICNTVKADAGAKVVAQLGCPAAYGPTTLVQTYEATCPAGKAPIWSYMTYTTSTPGGSSVSFQARTSPTNAFSGSKKIIADAHATPNDTQLCAAVGPSPCPIDLYAAFGAVDAKRKFLELTIQMTPGSNGSAAPAVDAWDLSYSCQDAE